MPPADSRNPVLRRPLALSRTHTARAIFPGYETDSEPGAARLASAATAQHCHRPVRAMRSDWNRTRPGHLDGARPGGLSAAVEIKQGPALGQTFAG